MAIFGKIGESAQCFSDTVPDAAAWRVMPVERPGNDYVCQDVDGTNGEWVAYVAPKQYTSLEFMERFTDAETIAIYTLAMTDIQTRIFLDKMTGANEIVNTDPRTIAGMAYLVSKGLITQQRSDEILG